ncbi:hypothetical protein BKN38_02440 [Helicobacter sp. CLO-3]|nr:hypothetical protein BKN38_02440 [Helicobacter sp. CLO-3]
MLVESKISVMFCLLIYLMRLALFAGFGFVCRFYARLFACTFRVKSQKSQKCKMLDSSIFMLNHALYVLRPCAL